MPEVSYMSAIAIDASAAEAARALTTRSPVAGLIPLSARVAPMTAKSRAVTAGQHCTV